MGLSEVIQRYQNTNGNTKNTKEMLGVPAGAPVFTGWNTKNTKNTTKSTKPKVNPDSSATPSPKIEGRPKMPPHALLVRVANLLGCSGDYLLECGLLEPCDLEEQAHTDPLVIAEGIRLDPRWD